MSIRDNAEKTPQQTPERIMRKHVNFTVATAVLAVAMISWAKSAVVATHADPARPAVGITTYVMPNSYLPIQVLEEAY
jgi:hypothetical protein